MSCQTGKNIVKNQYYLLKLRKTPPRIRRLIKRVKKVLKMRMRKGEMKSKISKIFSAKEGVESDMLLLIANNQEIDPPKKSIGHLTKTENKRTMPA